VFPNIVASASLAGIFFKDLLIIYAPLIMSKDFKDYTKQIYPKNRFLNTMSFALNLQQINFLRSANLLNVFSVN
jgi:hypothetical protein